MKSVAPLPHRSFADNGRLQWIPSYEDRRGSMRRFIVAFMAAVMISSGIAALAAAPAAADDSANVRITNRDM
ncbi:hypothetical protein [Actinomadura sp. 3N407]|uniref:hypothetical protein n=1 Tax=Actinomadura sp. 3N407 TaxID=3457423 RepID=UPI003FCD6BC6